MVLKSPSGRPPVLAENWDMDRKLDHEPKAQHLAEDAKAIEERRLKLALERLQRAVEEPGAGKPSPRQQ
jgi:hypothetical protein